MITLKTNFDKSLSIWDRQVQDKLTQDLDNLDGNYDSQAAFNIYDDIISIHYNRQKIIRGMYNRSKLVRASKFEWDDPRLANGVPIFARESPGVTKENHKLHTSYDKKIITNKSAYITGQAPNISGDDSLIDHFKSVDMNTKLMELTQSATRGGTSYLLAVSPEGENELFVRLMNEWECVSFYDQNSGDLKYSIRYWEDIDVDNIKSIDTVHLELYTSEKKYSFIYNGAWSNEGDIDHLMEGVPLVEFPNNTERLGDVELTISLQDAFDILNSDLSSEITQLRLSYLLAQGEGLDIDNAFIEQLKQTGIWPLDGDGDVKFIEKNLQSTAVENLKTDIERQIYEYSNSYNPNELGRDSALTAFQIRQKLFGLEQSSSETIKMFEKSFKHLYMIISDYLREFKSLSISEELAISFRRNIPSNTLEDLQKAALSGFKVSQDLMAGLMPFEIDQEENKRLLKEEKTLFSEDLDIIGDATTEDTVEGAVQAVKLSGIQISAANDIITLVGIPLDAGGITREAGINQLMIFLGLSEAQANQVMGNKQTGAEITPKAVDVNA